MAFSDFLKKFFEPEANKVRVRDVVREIPGSTKSVSQSILKGAQEAVRGSFRGGAALTSGVTGGKVQLTPETEFQKAFYGTNEKLTASRYASEFGIPQTARIAPVAGTALAGLDLVSGGKAKPIIGLGDDAVKAILRTQSLKEIKALLRTSSELDESTIKTIAPKFKNVSNTTQFNDVVSSLKERGFIKSVKEILPEGQKLKVAGQYIPRSTDELSMKAANLVKDNINEAERIVRTQSDEIAVATASELIKKYTDDAVRALNDVDKDALYDKAADVANMIAPKLTELGRAVQAASILGRMTPEGQLRFAAKTIARYNETIRGPKIPDLSKEDVKFITDEAKAIELMPDGWEKANRFKQLQEYTLDKIPTPIVKKAATVWKAGLLTGIKTSGLNIFSNSSHFATEVLKDAPAVIIDKAASLFTGERTKTFTLGGTPSGIKEGFEKGGRFWKTGFDERSISDGVDWRRVNFGKGPVAKMFQKYTDFVFRTIGAQDQPFYYGSLSRSLYDQALARGLNKGLKGKELKDYAKFLVDDPDEKMMHTAVLDAATAVFQNKTKLGDVAAAVRKSVPATEFLIPFSQTPSAVAMQIINYSPIGAAATLFRNIGKGKFNQRDFAQGLGRATVGSAPLAVGAALFGKDMVTLDYPVTERERQLWELEGRKANSVLVDGEWRSPMVLGPAGNLLLIGAHFQKNFAESGSPTEAMAKTILGSAKSFAEQTFLTGINEFMQAWSDPGRYGESYLAGFLSSFVPTIVSDVARATDEMERRATGIKERVQSRIPGLRQELEPKVDALGDDVERIGNFFEVMADPTRPSPIKDTPVVQELRRLTDAGFKITPTKLGEKKGYEFMTPDQNTELWVTAGELVEKKLNGLMAKSEYKALTDDEKAKLIEKFTERAKVDARAMMAVELTQDLSGEQLSARLKELKQGGLLTRDVYARYQELR